MVGKIGQTSDRRGTTGYLAPEILEECFDEKHVAQPGEFSRKSDIWALGCILYQLATTGADMAFNSNEDVKDFARGPLGEYPLPQLGEEANPSFDCETVCPEKQHPIPFVAQINSIISMCLATKASDRITAMKLKVWFEEMKEYMGADMSKK